MGVQWWELTKIAKKKKQKCFLAKLMKEGKLEEAQTRFSLKINYLKFFV